ncbi:hypothetical protein ACK3TF_002657 [Chlorella vulgaris]
MNRPTAALATLSAGKARLASVQRPLNALRSRCYHGPSKLSNRVVRVYAAAATDDSIQPSPPPLLTDARKEYNRQFQRPVFDFERWKTHRSSSRYLRHVLGMRDSKIILGLAPPLFYVMTLTTAVAVYGTLAQDGVVPALPDLKFASAPFGLTSFALSLLLVFRTNTSYQRWDEARKMWGSMVNRSRDFTRQALGYVPESQPELRSMLVRWSAAYPRALMCHLRPNENIAEEVKDILKPEEVKALVLTACLKSAQLPAAVTSNSDATGCVPAGAAYRMDENLTVYSDVTGGCERILRTPIPLSYTRHTSRFMMIWLTLLPFTLWDSCRWAALPITFIVSFLLLGIEEIGVSIEEPFTILPLEVIARTIETNLRELEATHGPATLGKAPEGARNATELLHEMIPSTAPNATRDRPGPRFAAEESLVGSRRQSKVKYIYRLLRHGDIGESLTSKTVYVLWPDEEVGTCTWYKAHVSECDVASGKGTIHYDETNETEECDLKELIQEGHIAFKEPRPVSHKPKAGEIGLNEQYLGRKQGAAAAADTAAGSDEQEVSEDESDAAGLEDSDSDVSFSSAELAGRKRKRVGEDESDEEVELEEFEKREIMRDMSDDEKPLGWRAEDLERQKLKGSKHPKQPTPKKAAATKRGAAARQQPPTRQRREAAAGVAAAVHAVAAVHAAMAADASSEDEQTPSARRQRSRAAAAAAAEDDEDEEAEAFARNLLARVTGKAQPGQKKEAGAFYGRQGSGGRQLERRLSAGQSEDELRQKVRAGIQQALEMVEKEAAGGAAELPEPSVVADAVEEALFKAYDGISKEYKQKFRTLQFNLKDPHNPDLRAHVLRGDFAPATFVLMTATELANKELAAYRKAKEEEALKMSVLDAEAAAKFSTAAALDARDQLSVPASMAAHNSGMTEREATPEPAADRKSSPSPPTDAGAAGSGGNGGATLPSPRAQQQQPTTLGDGLSGPLQMAGEGGEGGNYLVSDSAEAPAAGRGSGGGGGGGGEEYDPETALSEDEAKPGAAPSPAAPPLDWAAIKAAAVVEAVELQPPAHAPLSGEVPLLSPTEPDSPRSLRHLVLPAGDPSCVFGKGVWEGQFLVPGVGAFQLAADALAGAGDVAALLGDRELEVKGRLALQKLDHFLTELRHSRSRTVTLGLLSAAADCQPPEREAFRELISQYSARGRTGVVAPSRDVEAYLLPACSLTERLLAAARSAAVPQAEALLPAGGGNQIGPEQLMLAIIHRRDWRPPHGFVRPVRRPRLHPAPGAAAPDAEAGEEAGGKASAQALSQPPALSHLQPPQQQAPGGDAAAAVSLPAGLDFGALSALAAAFGVSGAGTEQQQQHQTPAPVAPVPDPRQQAAAGAPPDLQVDQLQQLLASLPPSTVMPGLGNAVPGRDVPQPADKPRRSRWEGAEESAPQQQQAAPEQPAPSVQQPGGAQQAAQGPAKRRRSRWEGEGGPAGEAPPPELSASAVPAVSAVPAAVPPTSGPMGPMQRVPMQRAAALQQQAQQQAYQLRPSDAELGRSQGPESFNRPPQQQAGGGPPRLNGGGYPPHAGGPPPPMAPPQHPPAAGPAPPPPPPPPAPAGAGFQPPAGAYPQQQQQYGDGGRGGRFGGRWGGRDSNGGRAGGGGARTMANLALCTAAMQARADCRAPLNRGMGRSTRATHLSSRNVAQRVFWGKKKEEPAPQAAAPFTDVAEAAPTAAAPAPAPAAAAAPAPSPAAAAAESNGSQAGDKTIIVESDGTIIIGSPEAVARAQANSDNEEAAPESAETDYLAGRANAVQKHFEGSLGADDFMQRVEMALFAFGFTGDNSIAMVNLCRDEVTLTLKHRIEDVFGSAFSTNGLGGALTCGVTGMGAGFSHSPLCSSNKERYVFFSFPHISINASGEVGPMSRPGRPGQSCACGALIKATNEIKSEGLTCNCKIPGVHDAVDPEMSILKQRIARRLRHEGHNDDSVKNLTLVDVTKVAERTISDDLEFLISKTVNTDKADYAVITGVQIHNWAKDFEDASPNMEFVAPTSAYVVVNGVKTHIDLTAMPPMTPRQMRLVAGPADVCNQGGQTMLREEEAPYAFDSKDARRSQKARLQRYLSLMKEEGLDASGSDSTPVWQSKITTTTPARCATADNSVIIDSSFNTDPELSKIREQLEEKYRVAQ